jgi:hypothetical protein
MKAKYIIASGTFVAFLFILGAVFVPQIGSGRDEARATTQAYVVESPHNYQNNMDQWYTIEKTGAQWIKCYFSKIATERNYDYVYVYDQNNVLKNTYTGSKSSTWSAQCTGDTMYIRLVTDYATVKYGFKVTQIQFEAGTTPDTTAPTISITAPANGATVTGTVSVTATASDNVGVTARYLSVNGGSYVATTFPYSWDTTALDNGANTLKARADDAAGNQGFSTLVTVTVDNSAPVQDGDEHFLGAVAGGETDWYTISAFAGGAAIAVSVSWSGSYDIDCYISATESTTTYLARGYTTANPETCSYAPTADGIYHIGVNMYTSSATSTNYDCHVTWQAVAPPPPPPPQGDKWGVIVGISDYKAINDLSYCDEDATDFYNYLKNVMGYATSNMRVLGDGHTANYPAYYGTASEYQYRACLQWVADNILSGHTFVFDTSGHGSGDGRGSSFLCAWDCNSGENGYDGSFYDTEVDDYTEAIAAKGAKVFVLIDHCYSGGMNEMMNTAHASLVYLTTTCTENGYGYDDSAHQNGAWTYWFLEAGLIGHFGSSTTTTMEAAFDWASANYPYSGGDAPMEFDGNAAASFVL